MVATIGSPADLDAHEFRSLRTLEAFRETLTALQTKPLIKEAKGGDKLAATNAALHTASKEVEALSELSHELVKEADRLHKLLGKVHDVCDKELEARADKDWPGTDIRRELKALAELRPLAVEQLKRVRYHHRHALWLQERFPDAELRDVEGLVKLVDVKELEENEWSLSPGAYVGVNANDFDDGEDFGQGMGEVMEELEALNVEALVSMEKVMSNLAGLAL